MNMLLFITILLVQSIPCFTQFICNQKDGTWVKYKEEKCFQFLNKTADKNQSLTECENLNKSSTLITIKNDDEQKFLVDYLSKFNDTYDSAWLGINSTIAGSKFTYKWDDKSDITYKKWAGGKPVDDGLKSACVQMKLTGKPLGEWIVEPCTRTSLVVCQKKIVYDTATVADLLYALNKRIDKLEQNIVPIDFIYVQLPNQTEPNQLWPQLKWDEITQLHAGLFFRAEGKGSGAFGEVQKANSSVISDIRYKSISINHGDETTWRNFSLAQGKWSGHLYGSTIDEWEFFTTKGELRPRNTAVRIWKRVA